MFKIQDSIQADGKNFCRWLTTVKVWSIHAVDLNPSEMMPKIFYQLKYLLYLEIENYMEMEVVTHLRSKMRYINFVISVSLYSNAESTT